MDQIDTKLSRLLKAKYMTDKLPVSVKSLGFMTVHHRNFMCEADRLISEHETIRQRIHDQSEKMFNEITNLTRNVKS